MGIVTVHIVEAYFNPGPVDFFATLHYAMNCLLIPCPAVSNSFAFTADDS